MEKLTLQQVYTKVRQHLLTQKEHSRPDALFACRYRYTKPTGEVLKCAVGCLIEDPHYTDKIEGIGINSEVSTDSITSDGISRYQQKHLLFTVLKFSGVDVDEKEVQSLLGLLQQLHDCLSPEVWESELDNLAKIFKLNVEP